ncbi:MAG: hypothetical protein JWQ48_529 [Conexibacter sp.]|nr:hypothetical protein [Conexibacter sp.]
MSDAIAETVTQPDVESALLTQMRECADAIATAQNSAAARNLGETIQHLAEAFRALRSAPPADRSPRSSSQP